MGTWKLKKNMRGLPVDYEKQVYAWSSMASGMED